MTLDQYLLTRTEEYISQASVYQILYAKKIAEESKILSDLLCQIQEASDSPLLTAFIAGLEAGIAIERGMTT